MTMHEIMKGMNPKTVYVAGPLFDEGERWWIEQIEQTIIEMGFDTFLPHRDNPEKTPETVQLIFENNRNAIQDSDLVVANLNGITTDDGTAWELGYAAALGKPAIGVFTDWRSRFEGEELVNLMISRSLNQTVRSLNELSDALKKWELDSE
ncbi:MAG: nucleoside 2-deoxyribosyltransferase [Acidimicrobiales bacterium]|nr:nucleoside 2-deoxyribosyltransferase [Acidimicrobiales bacterium]